MEIDEQFVREILDSYQPSSTYEIKKINTEPLENLNNPNVKFYKLEISSSRYHFTETITLLLQKQIEENPKLFFAHNILLAEFEINARTAEYIAKCIYQKGNLCALENPLSNGFKFVKEWNINHVKTVIDAMAKWHSSSFKIENCQINLQDDFKICSNNSSTILRQVDSYINTIFKLLTQNNFKEKFPNLKNTIQNYYNNKMVVDIENAKYKNVYCIGNISNKNTLFLYDKTIVNSCKFIDLAMLTYTSPLYDLLYLIYCNLSDTEILESKNELLKYYIDQLKNELLVYKLNLGDVIPQKDLQIAAKTYTKLIKFLKYIYNVYEILQEDVKNKEINEDEKTINNELNKIEYLLENDLLEYEEIYEIASIKTKESNIILQNIQFTRLEFGSGFLGDHYFMKINVNVHKEPVNLNFFVKFPPSIEDLKILVDNTNVFFKEYAFFSKILPAFKKMGIELFDSIPQCIWVNETTIVLEDLKTEGYSCINSRIWFDIDHVKIVLDNMAKIHASGFIYEQKKKRINDKNAKLVNEFGLEFKEALFLENDFMSTYIGAAKKSFGSMLELFYEDLTDVNVSSLLEWLNNKANDIYNWAKPSTKYPNTFCHADLWHSNIMFKMVNEKVLNCKFLDFQTFRYNTPGTEYMSFLYWCTNYKFRSENDTSMYYYEKLQEYCKQYSVDLSSILTYDVFLQSAEKAEPFCAIQACWWGQSNKQTIEQLKEFSNGPINKFTHVDRSECVLELCEKDSVYKEFIRTFVMDFKRLYLKSLK